jgi:hypothetical protein
MYLDIEADSRRATTVTIPDALKYGIAGVETLYSTVANSPQSAHYVFDMKSVPFLQPCGVIALLSAARRCANLSGHRVIIINLNDRLFSYLDRMDLFKVAEGWLVPVGNIADRWNRSSHTANLLELTKIGCPDDVEAVVERAERIFAPCLTEDELGSLLSVLSELCSNIFEHSYDPHGCALIQKYHSEQKNQSKVCLSVGDMGRGVRANLVERHGEFGAEPLDYIRAAMSGMTSRRSGKGGTGLQRVREITAAHHGYVCLRSETAAISDHGHKVQRDGNLAFVAGTQVSVEMHSVWEI